ncbi:unnamed protein product [Lepeophtheirus salmonis]|uniref:(salmon louse) hypothetical protein n=1 Tax=Lepeophtheirus salmonis TaxID=72036 RepID=A0A7R8H6W7_LEPSM|nr:unnamed protein product [Lepeophtheirus salmonis]CAF2911493.1 unnamed protein product [Lepeophtheirus salmonis]
MKFIDLLAFSLVLFNVVSPLVSASIKSPQDNEKVLEEHLSDLFVGLKEDPIINEQTVVERKKEEDGACHPKDLSCSGKVSLIDTITAGQIDDIIDVGSGSGDDSETVATAIEGQSDNLMEPIMKPFAKTPPLISLLQEGVEEELSIKDKKVEAIKEHSHEKVVHHLNNHAKNIKKKTVVPSLKARSDDILIPMDEPNEEDNKKNEEHSHGLLGSVFNFFG